MIAVRRDLGAPAAAVWAVLIDTTAWPAWGPTVRSAELSNGAGGRIGPASTGRVETVLGVWLPFEVTEWEEGRRWAWKVAGVPATGHQVEPDPRSGRSPAGRCRATIEVPSWAPVYAPVCWIALGRIGRLALSA